MISFQIPKDFFSESRDAAIALTQAAIAVVESPELPDTPEIQALRDAIANCHALSLQGEQNCQIFSEENHD